MTTVTGTAFVTDRNHRPAQQGEPWTPEFANAYTMAMPVPTQTAPQQRARQPESSPPVPVLHSKIDQGKFWVGAVLAAGAAALTGVVAMIVANGILRIPVVFGGGGSVDLVHLRSYGMVAAAVALLVAGLYDAMIHFAPRPGVFFGWLGGLATMLVALLPFTTTAPLESQIVLGAMNLLVGAVILALVPAAAISARRRG